MNTELESTKTAKEIAKFQSELEPMLKQMQVLCRKEQDALSQEFISANQITREQVELSGGNDKPWFGTVYEFGKWLAANPKKPWAEWNGRIYHTIDLINGRMPEMPAFTEHLPKP